MKPWPLAKQLVGAVALWFFAFVILLWVPLEYYVLAPLRNRRKARRR